MFFKPNYFYISCLFFELALRNLFSLFLKIPSPTPADHYIIAEEEGKSEHEALVYIFFLRKH